jgi:hypothetical protein
MGFPHRRKLSRRESGLSSPEKAGKFSLGFSPGKALFGIAGLF